MYDELNRQVDQLKQDSKSTPDRAQVLKLETEELGNVIRLLTPTQRRALLAAPAGNPQRASQTVKFT